MSRLFFVPHMARLSFTTMGTPDMSASQAIQAARRFAYAGIDLRVSNFKGELRSDSKNSDLNEIRGCLDGEGVELVSLLCYNDHGSEDKSSWQKMSESILLHMDLATQLGSPSIRIFAGDPHCINTNEFIKKSAEVIRGVLEKCPTGPDILLQNHKGSCSAEEGVLLGENVDSKRFGLAFAPDHCLIMGESFPEIFKRVKPYSKQLYLADIALDKNFPKGHRSVLPGLGQVPLFEAYETLGGEKFEGWVSFKWEKIWNKYLEEPEVALPYFIDFFNKKFLG